MSNKNPVELNGIHPYTPDEYQVPNEPEVRKQLEWFQDQKLGCLLHWGLYSPIGIIESWPLVDNCAHWARKEIDWLQDTPETSFDAFKQEYFDLNKSFNPTRYQPDVWAKLFADAGIRYCAITTKHHDGFCMYDTKYTDYKVTAPECPFSTHKYADITKALFEALRANNISACAYFSKADWHHEDFWEDHGIGHYTDSWPTYRVSENPEKWAAFREFTRNQIVEIVRDYAPVDILWMDAGWIRPLRGLSIDIDEIIAEARLYNPALIAVDRSQGGQSENYLTPEQEIPAAPMTVPWESCLTLSDYWSYHYDDNTYKSMHQVIHMFLDIVAKGGNLLLGLAPGPDGRIPAPTIAYLKILGDWLKKNGEGIYGTRAAAPYRVDDYAFTRKDGQMYAFKMYSEDAARAHRPAQEIIPYAPENLKAVEHLATGTQLPFTVENGQIILTLPDTVVRDPYADGFRLITES